MSLFRDFREFNDVARCDDTALCKQFDQRRKDFKHGSGSGVAHVASLGHPPA